MDQTEIAVSDDLRGVCQDILHDEGEGRDWKATGSLVDYQTDSFCGGFDADSGKFLFSYYMQDAECYFILSMDDVRAICAGTLKSVPIQKG